MLTATKASLNEAKQIVTKQPNYSSWNNVDVENLKNDIAAALDKAFSEGMEYETMLRLWK